MEGNRCPQCGAPIDSGAGECLYCGEKFAVQQAAPQFQQVAQPQQVVQPQIVYVQQPMYTAGIDPNWPVKSKIVAGLLALFLGGIGIHKFYLGKVGSGILCILFCWTFIPSVVAFFEGIGYLCSSDEKFMLKHHVRI